MAVEAGGGDGLGENDADGDEDGAGAGSERHGDFDARTFGVLIAAAEAEAALGQIFADGSFFLEAAAANASEDASLDAGAVAAGNHAFFDGGPGRAVIGAVEFGVGLDPDRWRIANAAEARDALADFKGLQFQFIQIDDFAALAEAALHEQTREGFLGFMRSREVDVPEVGAPLEKMNSVEEVIGRVLVDFGNDASAGVFPMITFETTAEVEFLADGEFLDEAQDAAVAADEQGLGSLRAGDAVGGGPGGLHRHAETHAVALPESIRECAHGHGAIREKSRNQASMLGARRRVGED